MWFTTEGLGEFKLEYSGLGEAKVMSSRKTGIWEMNGERRLLPAVGPAESLRRKLTSGLQGTVEKLNLFQEISPVRSRCQNWKDPRELLVQGPCYTDAEIETMELKLYEDQMRFGFCFFLRVVY